MASSASLDELQKKFEGNQRRYLAPLANEYRKTGDLERAIELCRAILPEYPEHLSGYVVFGQALYEAGQLADASEAFTTALSLDPENLIALRHLGDIARDRGDTEDARDWYQRVLDADPRNETIAAALQSLDAASSTARNTPPAGAPRSPTPTAASGAAMTFEAPSLGYGAMGAASASAQPTPASTGAVETDLLPTSYGASSDASDVARGNETTEAPDDAVDFDPGFFSAGADVSDAGDTADATFDVAFEANEARMDVEALAVDGAHEVDPSELALAAALDAPILDDPTPPAFDGDAAFDFQATTLDDELSVERGAGDDAFADAFDGASSGAGEPEPFTPAYGGGFDANSFFSDPSEIAPPAVTPPVDIGLESMEFVAPPRSSAAESEGAAGAGATADGAPFVTETMAELYLQQGFRDEALEVYEQLLAASPSDDNLRARVEHLRSGAPSSLGLTGSYPTVDAPATEAPAATANGTHAISAREFFAALAHRGGTEPEPDGGEHAGDAHAMAEHHDAHAVAHEHAHDDAHDEAEPESTDEESAESAPSASATDTSTVTADSTLAALFGEPVASADDERAASTLASLLGDGGMHGGSDTPATFEAAGPATQTEAPPERTSTPTPAASPTVASAPSRPAARELSLDDVFGASKPPARATPNSSFSFDQFFAEAQAPAAPEPVATPNEAPVAAPSDEASDLEQFNAWLEGLKKR